ncbi:MAG: MurR/RpiR family transcriptional regulator [Rhodobacteraceae bacterium]|nr:MurR/RpiR family transcriptional regulator [Paracoccaceae bacterium]
MADIFDRLNQAYENFQKVEKKIADYILSDVEMVLAASITELAAAAGVSPSSITRFSRLLGFKGFKELKLALARAKSAQSPYYHHSLQSLDEQQLSGGRLEHLYLQQIIATLNSTYENLQADDLVQTIELFRAAHRLKFFGVAVSGLIAQDAAIRFSRLGMNAEALADSHFQKITASLMSENDVAVCISHTGRSSEILDVASLARDKGAKVVCLTAPFTPLSRLADVLLNVNVFEEIDIYTPSISQFAYHYIIGLLAFHIGQSQDLDSFELLKNIRIGLKNA